jgi:hypothetical protein
MIYQVTEPGWLEPGWYIKGWESIGPFESYDEAERCLPLYLPHPGRGQPRRTEERRR